MPKFEPLDISELPKIKPPKLPPLLKSFETPKFKSQKKDVRPDRYLRNGIDVIDFAKMQFSKEEVKGFMRINILKYVTRYDRKGGIDDLDKAEHYLRMLRELEAK